MKHSDLHFVNSQEVSDMVHKARTGFAEWADSFALCGMHRYNPYHNHKHCQFVLNMGASIIKHDTGNSCSLEFILAALMHDYDHSGGREDDRVNIKMALEGVNKAAKHPRMECINVRVVQMLIEVTQYDGPDKGFKMEPDTRPEAFEQKAIRDADLMSIYSEHAADMLYGLFIECRIKNKSLKLDDFMAGNRKFLKGARMYTEYGNEVRERYLDRALATFEREMYKRHPDLCRESYA